MNPTILLQHTEEVAILWGQRDYAVRAPHYDLEDLGDHDDRMAAHLDGLLVAREAGWELVLTAFEEFPMAGEAFAAAWLALMLEKYDAFEKLVDRAMAAEAENPPDLPGPEEGARFNPLRGIASAMGWIAPEKLSGLVAAYLRSDDLTRCRLGVSACAMHRRDPGAVLKVALTADDPLLRARAAKAVGELGRKDLAPSLKAGAGDADPAVKFWSAWSAALLGEPWAIDPLAHCVIPDGPYAAQAAKSFARLVPRDQVRAYLSSWRDDEAMRRRVIQAVGALGDPAFLTWLLEQASQDVHARIAGGAIAMITGFDLAYEDLDTDPPQGFESGPNDNPHDDHVAPDADEDLPWPDLPKIDEFIKLKTRHLEGGKRYVGGSRVEEAERYFSKGKSGVFQHVRLAAAVEVARDTGNVLFPCSAPVYRQRLLHQAD